MLSPADIAPTPKYSVYEDGCSHLYRFRGKGQGTVPLLVVPSLVHRWYVLDLHERASLTESLLGASPATFCLDWGIPEDEDRFVTWDETVMKLARAVRRVQRDTGSGRVALLGYCVGGTLAGIFAALYPREVAAFINLAGPFDFAHAGILSALTDKRWFDPYAMAAAGNWASLHPQAGLPFTRPTSPLATWVNWLDSLHDAAGRDVGALEMWSGGHVPFPASAYATYIHEFYQENKLIDGRHRIHGERVDLGRITCPVLTVVAERDTICPPPAALALNDRVTSRVRDMLYVPGGHVGAVTGNQAPKVLYPAIADWLRRHTWN